MFQIRLRQLEERFRWLEPVLLQVNKSARKLDEPFIKEIARPLALGQPKFLEDIVRFIIKLPVEALEVPKIMGIQFPALASGDEFRDFGALMAHAQSIAVFPAGGQRAINGGLQKHPSDG